MTKDSIEYKRLLLKYNVNTRLIKTMEAVGVSFTNDILQYLYRDTSHPDGIIARDDKYYDLVRADMLKHQKDCL